MRFVDFSGLSELIRFVIDMSLLWLPSVLGNTTGFHILVSQFVLTTRWFIV